MIRKEMAEDLTHKELAEDLENVLYNLKQGEIYKSIQYLEDIIIILKQN